MAVLLRELPGFACDFSGTASFVSRMRGMGVIHAPVGCIGNYTGFDEPDWFVNPGMIFSSSMREDETIFGLDEIVIEKSVQSVNDLNPDFYVMIGCPPPALIGTDYQAIAEEVERRTGVPSISVDTNGFDTYRRGADKFFKAMAERFLEPMEKKDGLVNVIGYNHLDYCGEEDLKDLCSILSGKWKDINTCGSLEDFRRLPQAELNVVVSASALGLARYMEREFGMPYTCDLPVGGTDVPASAGKGGKKVLIIGDQVMSNATRTMVEKRYGCTCDVATFFDLDEGISRPGDAGLVSEEDLKNMLSRGYDFVIGDPLFRKFVNCEYVQIPQVAVSSRLFWNNHIPTFRDDLLKVVDGVLGH